MNPVSGPEFVVGERPAAMRPEPGGPCGRSGARHQQGNEPMSRRSNSMSATIAAPAAALGRVEVCGFSSGDGVAGLPHLLLEVG